MTFENEEKSIFTHRRVNVKGVPIHVVEAGLEAEHTLLFIHGWPTNWREFETVMEILSKNFHVMAIDLPGVGESEIPIDSYSKKNISIYIKELLSIIKVESVTLIGGDFGGQIVYAFLKNYPDKVSSAVIMNVAIPGVKPWDQVTNNPYIWHFKLHLIPKLPEVLVHEKELEYFSYFYDSLVGDGNIIDDDLRKSFSEAYSKVEALSAGFNLYREFGIDEKDNLMQEKTLISIPVLYLRGSDEPIDIETYIEGFRKNNFEKIESVIIDHCGHFSAIEQPKKVASAIESFISKNPS